MAYEKHTWTTGEVITAGKLNNMEDGIASTGGVMVVHSTYDESTNTTTLDKTWQEIYDALDAERVVRTIYNVHTSDDSFYIEHSEITMASRSEDIYSIAESGSVGASRYTTHEPGGYPVLEENMPG